MILEVGQEEKDSCGLVNKYLLLRGDIMKNTYLEVLELVNNAMKVLYCSDDDAMTYRIYNKLDEISEMIKNCK